MIELLYSGQDISRPSFSRNSFLSATAFAGRPLFRFQILIEERQRKVGQVDVRDLRPGRFRAGDRDLDQLLVERFAAVLPAKARMRGCGHGMLPPRFGLISRSVDRAH